MTLAKKTKRLINSYHFVAKTSLTFSDFGVLHSWKLQVNGVTRSQLASTNQGTAAFEKGGHLIGPIFGLEKKPLQMYPIPSMGLVYLPTFT